MISSSDSYSTVELDNFYVILPQGNLNLINKFKKKNKIRIVKPGFEYSSDKNGSFLSLNELKKINKRIRKIKFCKIYYDKNLRDWLRLCWSANIDKIIKEI